MGIVAAYHEGMLALIAIAGLTVTGVDSSDPALNRPRIKIINSNPGNEVDDNSNSSYATLGMRACWSAGMPLPLPWYHPRRILWNLGIDYPPRKRNGGSPFSFAILLVSLLSIMVGGALLCTGWPRRRYGLYPGKEATSYQ